MTVWNHDVTAAARMLRALAAVDPEKRADTVAFVVKVWLEDPGMLAALAPKPPSPSPRS